VQLSNPRKMSESVVVPAKRVNTRVRNRIMSDTLQQECQQLAKAIFALHKMGKGTSLSTSCASLSHLCALSHTSVCVLSHLCALSTQPLVRGSNIAIHIQLKGVFCVPLKWVARSGCRTELLFFLSCWQSAAMEP
jgi:hypothetical protein